MQRRGPRPSSSTSARFCIEVQPPGSHLATIADERLGAECVYATEARVLDCIRRGSGNLFHSNRRAEHAAKERRQQPFHPATDASQESEDCTHGFENEPQGYAHATHISGPGDGGGLHNKHTAIVCTTLLEVLLCFSLRHLFSLSVSGDETPIRHRCVHEHDTWNLVLRRGTQDADIGESI